MCKLPVKVVPNFWKRNFLGVWQLVTRKFKLYTLGILLGEKWLQKCSSKFVVMRRVVPKLSLFMGSGDLIIIGRGVTVGGGG